MTVTVEEDQIDTPTCSPGAFIRQQNQIFDESKFRVSGYSDHYFILLFSVKQDSSFNRLKKLDHF